METAMPSTIKLQALCCGRLDFERRQFFPDEAGGVRMTVPVPGYLLRHPKGTVVFDTGVACAAAADPAGVLGERLARIYTMAGAADENVVAQLARHRVAVDEVTHVVCSHLHFDHCGCNASFPHAQVLVQRAEMEAATAPGSRYDRRLWDLALDYRLIDGEHDLFDDGSVRLIPTPGHTPGHQSAIVRTARDRAFVLVADACYTAEHLERDIIPTVHWDARAMGESMDRLRRLRASGDTELMFGHDPVQWSRVEAVGGALG